MRLLSRISVACVASEAVAGSRAARRCCRTEHSMSGARSQSILEGDRAGLLTGGL
jgi:hypothetical protein